LDGSSDRGEAREETSVEMEGDSRMVLMLICRPMYEEIEERSEIARMELIPS